MKAWTITGGAADVAAQADVRRVGNTVVVTLDGVERVFLATADGDRWVLREGEDRRVVAVAARGEGAEVTIDGRRRVLAPARPGAAKPALVVTPPMPATVARLLVADGATVAEGDGLVAVTAMKMEVTLRAPHAGTARVRVRVGDKVMPGDVLVDVVR